MKFLKTALLAALLLASTAFAAFERLNTQTNADVDSIETVATFLVAGHERCMFEITVGAATLTDFDIALSAHPSGSFMTVYTVSGDYTQPVGIMVGASGDLTVQTVGTGWVILDVSSLSAVRFSAAGTSSTVAIKGACL